MRWEVLGKRHPPLRSESDMIRVDSKSLTLCHIRSLLTRFLINFITIFFVSHNTNYNILGRLKERLSLYENVCGACLWKQSRQTNQTFVIMFTSTLSRNLPLHNLCHPSTITNQFMYIFKVCCTCIGIQQKLLKYKKKNIRFQQMFMNLCDRYIGTHIVFVMYVYLNSMFYIILNFLSL